MTRTELIEDALADAVVSTWRGDGSFDKREARRHFLDALTAAGMVVVPREPTGEMLEAGRKAWKKPRLHVNYNPADELMTCGVIYRDMTEAANAE